MSTEINEEFLGLGDLEQVEEILIENFNGAVDANASRGPLPHDNYLMLIEFSDTDMAGEPLDPARPFMNRLSDKSGLYFMAYLKITSAGNAKAEHDGYTRIDRITTLCNRTTTGVQAVLQALGVDTIALGSHKAQALALIREIGGRQVPIGEEIDWEARLWDKEAPRVDKDKKPVFKADGTQEMGMEVYRLRGMKNFPKNPDGTYRHGINLDDGYKLKNGDPLPTHLLPARAFNFHRRWIKVEDMQPVEKPDDVAEKLQQSITNVHEGKPASTPPPPRQQTTSAPAPPQPATTSQAAVTPPATTTGGRPAPRRVVPAGR
jgi:hypothetical protein